VTSAVLITVEDPAAPGGLGRYYSGLADASGGKLLLESVLVRGSDRFRRQVSSGRSNWPRKIYFRLRETIVAFRRAQEHRASHRAIVHGHPHLAFVDALLGRTFALMIVGGEWGAVPGGARAVRLIARRAKLVVSVSNATSAQWLRGLVSVVVPPGLSALELHRSKKAARSYAARQESCSTRFLAVARLVSRKQVKEIARVTAELAEAGHAVALDVVGDGPERDAVAAVAVTSDAVTYHGSVSDDMLHALYAGADVFILCPVSHRGPQGHEGFGIVFLEAASYGLPVIASDTGGIPEAVHPEGSMLVSPHDWNALRASMIAIAEDRESRVRMSRANRAWAESNSWAARWRTMDTCLTQLAGL
jgi:glycosyltransferase involved in cell wall biosynthesis